MRTWLTETFNLAVPVVSAPMAGVAGGRLAAADGAPFGVGLLAWVLEDLPEELEAALAGGRPSYP